MLWFTNKTPHSIALANERGEIQTIPPSRPPVRVLSVAGDEIDCVQGIPLHGATLYGGVEGLPERRHATVVIVSQIAALAIAATMPDRDDVFYPDTGLDAVRQAGRVLAVKRLLRAA